MVSLMILLGSTSCGTILYPERRGQPAGEIDVGVAVLDGLGLLLFLVPGVIAFAVDFSTGAIYLPPETARLEFDPRGMANMEMILTDQRPLSQRQIESVLAQNTGQEIDLSSPGVRAARTCSVSEPVWRPLAEVLTANQLAAFGKEPESR